jgi:hypothetical protein
MRELTDLEAGRCFVILGDGETCDSVTDCKVRFSTEGQDAAHEWGDNIEGYRDLYIEELVRHYLATKGV